VTFRQCDLHVLYYVDQHYIMEGDERFRSGQSGSRIDEGIKKMEENFLLEQGGQCFPGFFLEIFYCALIFLRQKSPIAN